MNKIVACGRFASVFLFTICCLFVVAFMLPGASAQKRGRIIRRWAGRFLKWLGIRVNVSGSFADSQIAETGVTPESVGRLVIANHVSFLDVFVLNTIVPSSFVAKAEIASWPVFGAIAKAVGTIFIQRGNKRALLEISQNMQAALLEGRTLLMFPEGTTSDGTKMLKLHANLMEAAVREKADVIPIVLRYKCGDEVTTRAAYVGDTGLFECLWNVLTTPNFSVEATILAPMRGEDRHTLCRAASAAMAASIGCEDPLAPPKSEAVGV